MAATRYRQERTLVRGVCRMPGQDRDAFKQNVARLRAHFERFNLDVSEICQWLMSFRPGGKRSDERTDRFWGVFLEPKTALDKDDPALRDRFRLALFRVAAGWDGENRLAKFTSDPALIESVRAVGALPRTPTAEKLFARLRDLNPAHQLVLLKAAAEWIVARYQRGMENWKRQHEEWEKEKKGWESSHPELTEAARGKFTEVFKQLNIRSKRPRVCAWERLKDLRDNCEFAGERIGNVRHGPLCVSYKEFLREAKLSNKKQKLFEENAERYLTFFGQFHRPPGPNTADRTRKEKRADARKKAMARLIEEEPRCKQWFPVTRENYLQKIGAREDTLYAKGSGKLPHCVIFGEGCEFNPHTNDCVEYRKLLADFDEDVQKLEPLYREWRRDYLAGPSKPTFRYPSGRKLPMPKIFGSGFFRIDFDRSIVGLRLDDMPEDQFLEFGFHPWPSDYDPQPDETDITSVHVNFIGTRARLGFRFEVPHKPSRFAVSQDEIDELRSRRFPRRAQDREFLDAARERLLESFDGDPAKELRLMAVDLGDRGAHCAVYEGRDFKKCEALKVVKIDKLYDRVPDDKQPDDKQKNKKSGKRSESEEEPKPPGLGLEKRHVGRHLEKIAEEAREIAKKRVRISGKDQPADESAASAPATLGPHDMRRLTRHTAAMIRDWVRLNARRNIEIAERENVDLLVFESLRGFRPPGYDKIAPAFEEKKRRLAFFAYGRIRRKTAEKAVERGMRVVTAPYFYSSQVCAECGRLQKDKERWKENKRNRRFECEDENCRAKFNSDENAARVLARVFWGEITLPTERPS